MAIKLINVQGRAATGPSRPFLCEAEDGRSFFVKGNNVSPDQLLLEWTLGNLARDYGLPVAPFELVEIPEPLATQSVGLNRSEFAPGIAFGSQRVPFGEDLGESHLRHVPDETKIALICFDWWVRNPDRRLGRFGGSPNLMWDPTLQGIVIIDHDQALDPDFDGGEFFREHVFRDVRAFLDRGSIPKLRDAFEKAAEKLDQSWNQVPTEWLEDEFGSPRVNRTLDQLKNELVNSHLPVEGILLH